MSELDIYSLGGRCQIGHMPRHSKKSNQPIDPPNKIEEVRKRVGISMAKLADKIGTTPSQINKLEKGDRHVTLEWLYRLADGLRVRPSALIYDLNRSQSLPTLPVRVCGTVEAGVFQEAVEWPLDEQYEVWVPVQAKYAALPHFALKVKGPSMDIAFPEGTIAVCVRLLDMPGYLPESGRRYVVYRKDHGGGVEATVKELRIDDDGTAWLWPRSRHPNYQTPFKLELLSRHLPDGDEDLTIWALVVGSYTPEN